MTEPSIYHSTQDKLLVFVSSRLEECKEERLIVRNEIVALNHEPVLFEHVGARAYSARSFYLSRLRKSQVMVAIYRAGYGYVDSANGMQISGVEDEFRNATSWGIPTLCYVHRLSDRDPRLQTIVDDAEKRFKVCFYDNPDELGRRVRDDLTAFITERVLIASAPIGALLETSANILAQVLKRAGVVVNRSALVEDLKALTAVEAIVCLHGPAGIGKTTLAAQIAQAVDAPFIRASDLTPRDLFVACASALSGRVAVATDSYSTLEGSRGEFIEAWKKFETGTLIVDECEFISELVNAITAGGGVNPRKRLILTSREPVPLIKGFLVPPLTRGEVEQILATAGKDLVSSQLVEAGNPLQIHEAVLRGELGPVTTGFDQIGGTTGDLLRYLALSNVPLSAEDLLKLRADTSYSVEKLFEDIKRLGGLIEDSPRGLRLMHAETALALVAQLRESPQRFRFYVNGLIRLFEEAGSLARVYEVAELLGDGSEKRYAVAAAREAAFLGDWRLAVRVIDKLLTDALDSESKASAFELMTSLVYPLELMGDTERAASILDKAQPLADSLGSSAQLRLEEVRVSARARRGLGNADIVALEGIYERYGRQEQPWDQAVVGLELSVLYMAGSDYERAIEILEPTLATFERLGDEYGVDLAQKNLASALSAVPGREHEAEPLIQAIERRASAKVDSRRYRAWLCNILTRRLRKAGRYEEAEKMALEAVEIGSVLGDEHLRAINLINLGNVYGDQEKPEQAIRAYDAAAVAAQKCGRRDVEADSSRLLAGIHNDFPEIQGVTDNHRRARMYAQHAVGLLRGARKGDALARALVELAEAQDALGEQPAAVEAYFEAALEFAQVSEESGYERSLVYGSHLALPDHVDLYLTWLARVLGVDRPDRKAALVDQFISLMAVMLQRLPKGALIPLLGAHVHQAWLHLPSGMRSAFAMAVVKVVRDFARGHKGAADAWRVLYAGIVLCHLMRDGSNRLLNARLAESITRNVDDVFVRQDGPGSRSWTVVLDLGRRVTVTIVGLDDAPVTSQAGFALAMFIKAFEQDLLRELLGGAVNVDEQMIQIGDFESMPQELRSIIDDKVGMSDVLKEDACAVSRPADFKQATPTIVFLGPKFVDGITFGEGRGGSFQMLFGLTLVELTFQLLRGEVETEAIRPKVVTLVKKTLL